MIDAWQVSRAALEQEARERATVLQTHFENFVHADATSLRNAKKGKSSPSPVPRPPASRHVTRCHVAALSVGVVPEVVRHLPGPPQARVPHPLPPPGTRRQELWAEGRAAEPFRRTPTD